MGRLEDILAIRNKEFPEPCGTSPNMKVKERRKEANKRYRESSIGKAHARQRSAIVAVKDVFIRNYLKANPAVYAYYYNKFFTHRIDGLGSDQEIKTVNNEKPEFKPEIDISVEDILRFMKKKFQQKKYRSTDKARVARDAIKNIKENDPARYKALLAKAMEVKLDE